MGSPMPWHRAAWGEGVLQPWFTKSAEEPGGHGGVWRAAPPHHEWQTTSRRGTTRDHARAKGIVTLMSEAETRIEIGISHIRQGLGHDGYTHGHHGTGFDQVNVLVKGCLQEEGTKTF